MHGKRLQALDMDCVLPVPHLELEKLWIAADDSEGSIVQRRQGGLRVSQHTSMRSTQCNASVMVFGCAFATAVL